MLAVRGGQGAAPSDLPPGARTIGTRLYPHALSNTVELGRLARTVHADVVVAHNYTPLGRVPAVTFVHDVMFRDHPEWFSRTERAYFAPMIPLLRAADAVATSSRTEADRIEGRSGRPVTPVGLGVPRALTDAVPRPPAGVDPGSRSRCASGASTSARTSRPCCAPSRCPGGWGPRRPSWSSGASTPASPRTSRPARTRSSRAARYGCSARSTTRSSRGSTPAPPSRRSCRATKASGCPCSRRRTSARRSCSPTPRSSVSSPTASHASSRSTRRRATSRPRWTPPGDDPGPRGPRAAAGPVRVGPRGGTAARARPVTRRAAAQGTERPAARAAARPRVVVHLAHEQDPVAWRARHAAGRPWTARPTATTSPRGRSTSPGACPTASDRSWPASGARSRRGSGPTSCTRGATARSWGARTSWTHTEREHLAVGLVRTTLPRRRRPAVLAQSVWLWDRWDDLGRARRRLFAAVLRGHAVEAVHSDVNRRVALDRVPGRRVVLVPFGTAPATGEGRAAGSAASAPEVLAVGNDRDRDWAVLRAALDLLPGVTARIASRSAAAARVAVAGRVDVAPAAGRAELARLYEGCRVVVVPLRENRHASGATACVEAMAAGRALVVTDAGGVRDYVAPGRGPGSSPRTTPPRSPTRCGTRWARGGDERRRRPGAGPAPGGLRRAVRAAHARAPRSGGDPRRGLVVRAGRRGGGARALSRHGVAGVLPVQVPERPGDHAPAPVARAQAARVALQVARPAAPDVPRRARDGAPRAPTRARARTSARRAGPRARRSSTCTAPLPPLNARRMAHARVMRSAGTRSSASDSLHHTIRPPAATSAREKSVSSPRRGRA